MPATLIPVISSATAAYSKYLQLRYNTVESEEMTIRFYENVANGPGLKELQLE